MRKLLVAAALAALAASASAEVITVEFNGISGGTNVTNYVEDGFRFSPSCHYDTVSTAPNSPAMGWDRAGCDIASTRNMNYLGAGIAAPQFSGVFVDRAGEPFSLLSVFLDRFTVLVFSSNGGFFRPPIATGEAAAFAFSGPEWTDVSWLLFSASINLGGPQAHIDDVTFDVKRAPEPGTLALLALGFVGIGIGRGRLLRRVDRAPPPRIAGA